MAFSNLEKISAFMNQQYHIGVGCLDQVSEAEEQ